MRKFVTFKFYKYSPNKKFSEYFNINNKTTVKSDFIKKYSDPLTKLYEFKIIVNKLLKEKIFHYSVLNNSVIELSNLQRINEGHQKLLSDMIKNYHLDFTTNRSLFLDKKISLMNSSSATMSYKAFLDLLKSLHEQKEDELNNVIRDVIENDYQDEVLNRNLVILRDQWRESLSPEVLDAMSQPIHKLKIIDTISLELNKRLLNLIV